MKIVFIGAGNLATHLAKELYNQSFDIVQVYSRTLKSANELADKVAAASTDKIENIDSNADIYIFSISDSALETILSQIQIDRNKLLLHTAGSVSIDIFKEYSDRYGVIYPFQTFSKLREINFKNIPIFIEANNTDDRAILEKIAEKFSNKIYYLSSDKRQYLHLTGVFACNFVNHMYNVADQILSQEDIPFDVVLPLIDETANKVHHLRPTDAQTGPAIRYDENIINKHLSLITDSRLKDIYKIVSENIHETSTKK